MLSLKAALKVLAVAVCLAFLPDVLEQAQLGIPASTDAPGGLPPGPIFHYGMGIIDWLERLQAALTPPNLQLLKLMMGHIQTASIHAAVKTGLVEALAAEGGPRTLAQLAESVTGQPCGGGGGGDDDAARLDSCDAALLRIHRLLRSLETVQIVRSDPADGTWALTRVGEFLSADNEFSMRSAALNYGDDQFGFLSELPHTVLTGESAYARTHGGLGQWEYCNVHPEQGAVFDGTMTSLGMMGMNKAAAEDYAGFGTVGTLVELGCGEGTLLDFVLRAWPGVDKGVCFDQPETVERGAAKWAGRETMKAGRVELAAGSFFEAGSIPGGGDAYMMKQILHDWSDDESVEILGNIRAAMPPSARLLVVERVLKDRATFIKSLGNAQTDIVMLATFGTPDPHGARERTREEWAVLYERAGFELTEVLQLRSPQSMIVGRPVTGSQ